MCGAKYQIYMKLAQISHAYLQKVYLEIHGPTFTFYGGDVQKIYYFIFASCELSNQKGSALSVEDICSYSLGLKVAVFASQREQDIGGVNL